MTKTSVAKVTNVTVDPFCKHLSRVFFFFSENNWYSRANQTAVMVREGGRDMLL